MQQAYSLFLLNVGHCEQVYLQLHADKYRKNNHYDKKTWFPKERTNITTKSKQMHQNRVRALQSLQAENLLPPGTSENVLKEKQIRKKNATNDCDFKW